METDLLPSSEGINGINLANYFPNRRSYNSVVYFHKRFLRDIKEERAKDIKKDEKPDKGKSKKKKTGNNVKHDKCQQFNSETINQHCFKYEPVENTQYNTVLDQTIKFAKNLVPLVIPKESAPVFYTIKSSQKYKKRGKKTRESSIEADVTYNKDTLKKCERSHKKHKKTSIRDSIDPSSQNTLDDIHININQSCSFSESTEVKFHKKVPQSSVKLGKVTNENSQKFLISDSFDAFATESLVDGNKIKIHLMSDKEKNQFSESIQVPIINTIKDYLKHLDYNSNKDINTNLKSLQKAAKDNSQKLDNILELLTCIQRDMDIHKQVTEASIPRAETASKASRLEEIGKDIIEVKENTVSEEEDISEEYNKFLARRRSRTKSVVVAFDQKDNEKEENRKDALGCGEEIPGPLTATSGISQTGVKPERPNRIPARFCWTDADRKK